MSETGTGHRKAREAGGQTAAPRGTDEADQRWSMDFVTDALADGGVFRTLNIVDDFSRECVAIEVHISLCGDRVA